MKIEEGKYYKTRDGRKVGPMYSSAGEWLCDHTIDDFHPMYSDDGLSMFFTAGVAGDYPIADLIEEWRDPIDVYTIPTMPFGLLTPEQQQALRDHDGGLEGFLGDGWAVCAVPSWHPTSTYRAKPKPKRETVKNREMYITPRGCIASNGLMDGARRVTITYDTVDGVIDATTYRVALR